jgi:hypothetical protein
MLLYPACDPSKSKRLSHHFDSCLSWKVKQRTDEGRTTNETKTRHSNIMHSSRHREIITLTISFPISMKGTTYNNDHLKDDSIPFTRFTYDS